MLDRYRQSMAVSASDILESMEVPIGIFSLRVVALKMFSREFREALRERYVLTLAGCTMMARRLKTSS